MKVTQQYINQLVYDIVGCAIEVHKQLGPGLLETIYEKCLIKEIQDYGFHVKSQVPVPIRYKGKLLNQELKLDLLINNLIIIELKAVKEILPKIEDKM